MRIATIIVVLFCSVNGFSQTASSKPLSEIMPDSLRRVNHQSPLSREYLASEKALPAINIQSKKHPNRPIAKRELPGNAAVNIDSIQNRNRRFLR